MSRPFLRSFALIVIAEVVTIVVAWALLGINANRWIEQKTSQTIALSQAAASGDWSRIDEVKTGKQSRLFRVYQQRVSDLTQHYFARNGGSIFIAVVKNGRELQIAPNDDVPMDDSGRSNEWEAAAYSKQRTTSSPVPIADENGTYLAAYTPVVKSNHVIGLIVAEYDEAPMSDFQAIIGSSFWLSVIPAVVASLIVAYVLASMFVEPMDVLREIEETARTQRGRSPEEEKNDPWGLLTPKEKEIAELLRRGIEHIKDLAETLSVGEETIKQHLKNIKAKTGWSKMALAVQAAARRSASWAS